MADDIICNMNDNCSEHNTSSSCSVCKNGSDATCLTLDRPLGSCDSGYDSVDAVPVAPPVLKPLVQPVLNVQNLQSGDEPVTTEVMAVPATTQHGDESVAASGPTNVSTPIAEPFDIFLIHCKADINRVDKIRIILTEHVTFADGTHPRVCMDNCDIPHLSDEFDYLLAALDQSKFKFIFMSDNSDVSNDGWLKFQHHHALAQMIKDNDQSIIPVVLNRDVLVPKLFSLYRPLYMTRLLGGVSLDDFDPSHPECLDENVLRSISAMLYAGRFPSSQQAIVRIPSEPRFELEPLLRPHWTYLTDHMDTENGLLATLYSGKMITFNEMDRVRHKATYFEKNEELLNIVIRRPKTDLKEFIAALESSGQPHVANVLKKSR